MEYRYLRVSDLARAIVYQDADALEWKPFLQTRFTDAHKIHEERKHTYCNGELLQLTEKYYSRRTGNIIVTGKVDALIQVNKKKSILEVKTFQGTITKEQVELAVVQVKLYAWILRRWIKDLSTIHVIEFINRQTGEIYQASVQEEDMEPKIWWTVYSLLDKRESHS
ncbi:MAG: hypothetical protein OH337_03690 [Candidatus Parvarchaeota archaeon]|nr:hypothetical protein [Candidatus Haiyanarchaeum thermophilum]